MELLILAIVLILAVATVDFCPKSTYDADLEDDKAKIKL